MSEYLFLYRGGKQPEDPAEGPAENGIHDRLRGHHIDRTGKRVVLKGEADHPDHHEDLNEREPRIPTAHECSLRSTRERHPTDDTGRQCIPVTTIRANELASRAAEPCTPRWPNAGG